MTLGQQLRLTAYLMIPVMAQISYRHAVHRCLDGGQPGGANAAASIGLVSTNFWLFWGCIAAAAMGFSCRWHIGSEPEFSGPKRYSVKIDYCHIGFSSLLAVVGISSVVCRLVGWWRGGNGTIRPSTFGYSHLFPACLAVEFPCGRYVALQWEYACPYAEYNDVLLDVVFNFFLIFPTRHWNGSSSIYRSRCRLKAWKVLWWGTVLAEPVTAGGMMWYLCRPAHAESSSENGEVFYPNGRHCVSPSAGISLPMGFEHMAICGKRRSQRRWSSHRSASLPLLPTRSPPAESLAICPATASEATTTLVGQEPGANRIRLLRRSNITVWSGMLIMGVAGGVDICGGSANHRRMTPVRKSARWESRFCGWKPLRSRCSRIYRSLRYIRRCG